MIRLIGFLLFIVPILWGAEPIAGRWLLQLQQIAGQKTDQNPLTLTISESGKMFQFSYVVTANDKPNVSLEFSSPIDGTETDIHDGMGMKIGTVTVTKQSDAHYTVLLKGPNRPDAAGQMTVSSDGKTLTSESDVKTPSGLTVHTVQTFTKQ